MAKTLRKRKIAKAYGLKLEVRTLRSGRKINIVKRKLAGSLIGVEFYVSSKSSIFNEIKFYECINKLRPKTFKSCIGGNY